MKPRFRSKRRPNCPGRFETDGETRGRIPDGSVAGHFVGAGRLRHSISPGQTLSAGPPGGKDDCIER
ncbi:MAG: hypothetical protein DBX44_01635 [Oscillospiraceae bacterium]|nr:MAG: hypothetical protein DBX44_01635 [Oscillospiraceae bacterium]